MPQKSRPLVLGSFIAVVLVVAISWLLTRPASKPKPLPQESFTPFFPAINQGLEQLEIKAVKDQVTVQQRPDGWWLSQPVESRADSVVVQALVAQLGQWQPLAEVAPGSRPGLNAQDPFGFIRRQIKYTISYQDGRVVAVTLGGSDPVTGLIFAQIADSDKIYLTEAAASMQLPYLLENLPDRRVVSDDLKTAFKFSFRRAGSMITAERRPIRPQPGATDNAMEPAGWGPWENFLPGAFSGTGTDHSRAAR